MLGVACAAVSPAFGEDVQQLEEIDVVSTTPSFGDEIDRDKIPGVVTTIRSDDASPTSGSTSSVTQAIARKSPSVSLSDVQGNPYFKDFYYRGFVASPLNGTPQGVAVYQNGVRQNEAFGDTVNFDLIPDAAIDSIDLWSNNPVFGLNALGGALNIRMKDGFGYQGLETEFKAGSFGHVSGSAQWGRQFGNWAAYLALEGERENGWRDFSCNTVKRAYGDVGYKGDAAELHLNVALADTHLGVVGPTPRQLIDDRRSAVYTGPQTTDNKAAQINLSGAFELTDAWSLKSNIYYRGFKQRHVDGNDTDIRPCAGDPTRLCLQADDVVDPATGTSPDDDDPRLIVRDRNGDPITTPAGFAERPGSVERSWTKSQTIGGTAQATNSGELFGKANHFVFGASYDHGWTTFRGNSELGVLPDDLQVVGTGDIYHTTFPGGILPTDVSTRNDYLGLYASDTIDLTDRLSATLGARLNYAHVKLSDHSPFSNLDASGDPVGPGANGSHSFTRLNPMAGVAYKVTPDMTAYASYAETNRAPTPLELACADPLNPCQLEGFLVSDPVLKQVVTRTGELGLRGRGRTEAGGDLHWRLGGFYAYNRNDILTIPSAITGRGYFANSTDTARAGLEASVDWRNETWSWYANYSYVDATFRKSVTLGSPNSPFADANGEIHVSKGDRLPAIPAHQFKLGAQYRVSTKLTVGGDMTAMAGSYLVGDESNQDRKLRGYAAFNFDASYQLTEQIRLFGRLENAFNARYATYGAYFDTGGAGFLGLTDPRSVTPARPRAIYGGLACRFAATSDPVLTTKD